jgi:hypothetical protein
VIGGEAVAPLLSERYYELALGITARRVILPELVQDRVYVSLRGSSARNSLISPRLTTDLRQVSPYPIDGGELIGIDPRKVPLQILSRYHSEKNPLKALRARCLDCCCGVASEHAVTKCLEGHGGVSVVVNANASIPSRTPAGLTDGGSGHADTINSYPPRAAGFADLRDHVVRLMKRYRRHGLCRRCDG